MLIVLSGWNRSIKQPINPSYLTGRFQIIFPTSTSFWLEGSAWFLGPALHLNCVELSLRLTPSLGKNSLLRCACCLTTMCLPSGSYLRHFSLALTGLRAPLSRFLEGELYKYPEWMNACVTRAKTDQAEKSVTVTNSTMLTWYSTRSAMTVKFTE